MSDFPDSIGLRRTAQAIYAGGGIVSSVRHGACALISLRDADGSPLARDRPVTGFSTVEEKLAGVKGRVPFLPPGHPRRHHCPRPERAARVRALSATLANNRRTEDFAGHGPYDVIPRRHRRPPPQPNIHSPGPDG
jgi:putative intracellular protease/amidase